jgi:hypothetical protein
MSEMKVVSKAEILAQPRHPWGDEGYGSDAHAAWLVTILIKDINRQLKAKSELERNRTMHVHIRSDLSRFSAASSLLVSKVQEAGWNIVRIVWDEGNNHWMELN